MAGNEREAYDVCTNWGLYCYDMKETEKSVILKCSKNRKDKQTGEYTKPIYIDVTCPFDTCEIEQDDYKKSFINVDGTFAAGGYTNKDGEKVSSMTIFAARVTKSVKK